MSSLLRVCLAILLHVLPSLKAQTSSNDGYQSLDDNGFLHNVPSSWSALWSGPEYYQSTYLEEQTENYSPYTEPSALPVLLRKLGAHEDSEGNIGPSSQDENAYHADNSANSQEASVERRTPGSHFGYEHPEKWRVDNPECGGNRQSPIDLSSDAMARLEVSSLLTWSGYWNQPQKMTLVNNGHTVELSGAWDNDTAPFVWGGPLEGEYAFAQLHFHWSQRRNVGSEHTINNQSFPMEMHMVHYKKEYGSLQDALKHEDGLTVMAFFFEVSDEANYAVTLLQDAFKSVEETHHRIPIKPFPLAHFQLAFQGDYVAYLGSLTTPPCKEVVTWVVATNPLAIAPTQMDLFRHIQLEEGDDHNYRPVQPANGRRIYYISY